MNKEHEICKRTPTEWRKFWPYDERYSGPEDEEGRRNGFGKNHWSGAESLECYKGNFTRNAMHGYGDYRWRHGGPENEAITYEGHFYANHMHGYGTMSYPIGLIFTGLFQNDIQWGPGVMTHVVLRQDVGFWRNHQLVRLGWRPPGPSVCLDLMTAENAPSFVEPYRKILLVGVKKIGETNEAVDLLKENGADPVWASKNWTKLYSKYSTDIVSPACHVDAFDNNYYKGTINYLEEVDNVPQQFEDSNEDIVQGLDTAYSAWNNSEIIVDMMKHCYKHNEQRVERKVSLEKILNGQRRCFRPPDRRERDSRTLLMASYLGQIINVAQIITEYEVCPDVTDLQGNTAIMYAACADNPTVIHFLVDAGADVNIPNDSCCTALGLALMRYVCVASDVPRDKMVQALLPPPMIMKQPSISVLGISTKPKISEWLINRRPLIQEFKRKSRSQSNPYRTSSTKKIKSSSIIEVRKKNSKLQQTEIFEYDSDDSFSEDKRIYNILSDAYAAKVSRAPISENVYIPYVFAVTNVIDDVLHEVRSARYSMTGEKGDTKRPASTKTSNVVEAPKLIYEAAQDSNRKLKKETLSKIMLTINQLLSDGAKPNLVRCPQPALFMGVASESPELVRNLITFGVDIHERNPEMLNYSALEYAISRPFTPENVEVISTLLEHGANAQDRMLSPGEEFGPTLMHAVFAKKCVNMDEEQLMVKIIDMLLKYHCDPTAQYNGQSPIDIAMMKTPDVLNTFVKNIEIDLNKPINNENQTILVKIFSIPYFRNTTVQNRFTILTDLLLNGADPLLECQNEDEKFCNVFVFARRNLASLEEINNALKPDSRSMINVKLNNGRRKSKSDSKTDKRSLELKKLRPTLADIRDFRVALDLVTECARLLHVRWLQAKLTKSLFAIIYKFKHRQWNMILKELPDHKTKSVGLWLTPQRCLEIWDILKSTRRPIYKDNKILKHLLCLVQYFNKRSKKELNLNGAEKTMIESDVGHLLKEHDIVSRLAEEAEVWKGIYVKPELYTKNVNKFNICFECALPLRDFTIDEKIMCPICNLVFFCSYTCVKKNVLSTFCHPCNDCLKQKFLNNSFILEI